jgi:hypothetical protein
MLPPDRYELRRRAEARGRGGHHQWPERDRVLRAVVARLLDEDEPGEARFLEPDGRDRTTPPS